MTNQPNPKSSIRPTGGGAALLDPSDTLAAVMQSP